MAWKHNGRNIKAGKSWTDDNGYKHPYNWADSWTDADKEKWKVSWEES